MWYGTPNGWAYGYGMMGGIGPVFMVLLLILLIGLAYGLLRDLFGDRRSQRGPARTALDILDERYARGEIDADDYKRRRADLGR